jgi:hypothetical protein
MENNSIHPGARLINGKSGSRLERQDHFKPRMDTGEHRKTLYHGWTQMNTDKTKPEARSARRGVPAARSKIRYSEGAEVMRLKFPSKKRFPMETPHVVSYLFNGLPGTKRPAVAGREPRSH